MAVSTCPKLSIVDFIVVFTSAGASQQATVIFVHPGNEGYNIWL